MKQRNKESGVALQLCGAMALLVLAFTARSFGTPDEYYEGYYLYLGNSLSELEATWTHDVQGIGHDSANWFITQTEKIWRVPLSVYLSQADCGPEVGCANFDNWPVLAAAGYNHLGDLEHFQFGNHGFLLVPIEGEAPAALGVFDASTLQCVGHAPFPGQAAAAWCAVDPQGRVYSSNNDTTFIRKYSVDWQTLIDTGVLNLTHQEDIVLRDENGNPVQLGTIQGGAVTPSGDGIFLSVGFVYEVEANDGLHEFDLSTGWRLQRSTYGTGYFNFEWHPGWEDGQAIYQEPEGLTIWDLSGIGLGNLHVLMLDNDLYHDDIYLKHYSNTIWVNQAHSVIEYGSEFFPFQTITPAYNMAWNDSILRIKPGSYPESITFSKQMKITAAGGSVVIGE